MSERKLKIAVTGGIGSGKSLVTEYFEGKGFPVIRSDDVAKDLMTNDPQIQKKIIKAFGQNSFSNGQINTTFISHEVFNSEEKIKIINSIIHPATTRRVQEIADNFLKQKRIVFVESALVYEAKIAKKFDHVILVVTDEAVRIKRTIEKRKLSEVEIGKRMAFQMPDEEKIKRADFVIENNSTIDELKTRADFILSLLQQM